MAERKFVLADSHTHIDMPQFDSDREEVVHRARAAGVEAMLLVGGVDEEKGHAGRSAPPSTSAFRRRRASTPTKRGSPRRRSYDELRTWPANKRVVAVGEIGLDFHYDHSPRDVQRDVFRAQVRLAREASLPVIIHTREADDETAALLEVRGRGKTGGVIHCFTGGHDLARRALALGFYLSFSGILAFPRSEVIQEVARTAPLTGS